MANVVSAVSAVFAVIDVIDVIAVSAASAVIVAPVEAGAVEVFVGMHSDLLAENQPASQSDPHLRLHQKR